jgi:phosphinothricin acetyltransferase
MTGLPLSVRLRRARAPDLPRITEIYNEAVRTTTGTFDTEPRTLEDRTRWFHAHDDRHPVLVAETRAEAVGWGALSAWSDRRAYEETGEVSIYVAEAFRGQGVGKALLSEILQEAPGLGYHSVLARISEGNEASLGLHRRAGFAPVGVMREVGVKFGRRLDVHVLQWMAPVGPVPGNQRITPE